MRTGPGPDSSWSRFTLVFLDTCPCPDLPSLLKRTDGLTQYLLSDLLSISAYTSTPAAVGMVDFKATVVTMCDVRVFWILRQVSLWHSENVWEGQRPAHDGQCCISQGHQDESHLRQFLSHEGKTHFRMLRRLDPTPWQLPPLPLSSSPHHCNKAFPPCHDEGNARGGRMMPSAP